MTALDDFYFTAYYRCKYEHGKIPSVRAIQELVQTWKALRKG
jgi:hypothetical protein